MAIGIIALFILALLLGGVIVGIVLWTGGARSGGEMSCGGCGYAVRGLESLSCPECGADLRMVGINRGRGRGSRGAGIALTVCCGGALMLGCLGSAWFTVSFDKYNTSTIQAVPLQSQSSQTISTPLPQAAGDGDDPAEDAAADDPSDPVEPAP